MNSKTINTNIYPEIFPSLNIAKMQVVANSAGPGCRFVIWLQGCQRTCSGCINTPFLPLKTAEIIPVDSILTIILQLWQADSPEKIEGITLTGGEPLLQAAALFPLLAKVKESGLSVICYTGFDYDELQREMESPEDITSQPVTEPVAQTFRSADDSSSQKQNPSQNKPLRILRQFFQHIDLLIDGEFRKDLPRGGTYCASANQKLRFLTNRYSPDEIKNHPESTFTIGEGGMEFTGILSPDIAEKMKMRLRQLGVVTGDRSRKKGKGHPPDPPAVSQS